MKTIAEILNTCKIGDSLKDGKGNFWKVEHKYEEEGEMYPYVIIAIPADDNKRAYELWNTGLECDVVMDGLEKVVDE